MSTDHAVLPKLKQILEHALAEDEALRAQYEINGKFRFIRDRLNALLERLKKDYPTEEATRDTSGYSLTATEVPIYVYLYNTHGATLKTWQKMVGPQIFYEYSVNRPIYRDKNDIESLLRAKKDLTQHAYLTIAVNAEDIIPLKQGDIAQDVLGHPLIKVKEGSLQFAKLIAFTHDHKDYIVDEQGEFVRKT